MRYKDTFKKYCENGEIHGSVSSHIIDSAERELNVVFPKEYKDFLEQYGAVLMNGTEIFGLPNPEKNDPPLFQSVLAETNRLRKIDKYWKEDRKHYIPISNDGMGISYYLDTNKSPNTNIWAIGPGIEKLVSTELYKFFVGMIQDQKN